MNFSLKGRFPAVTPMRLLSVLLILAVFFIVISEIYISQMSWLWVERYHIPPLLVRNVPLSAIILWSLITVVCVAMQWTKTERQEVEERRQKEMRRIANLVTE